MKPLNLDNEVFKFMDKYGFHGHGRQKEVPVKAMRRIIPLLMLYIYGCKDDQQVRKGKTPQH